MRGIIILIAVIMLAPAAFAAKIPDNIRGYVNGVFPGTDFRFDGVVILPDNTVYLPLFPAKTLSTAKLDLKQTIPAGRKLSAKPDVAIFNNNFVLLKVIKDEKGGKTVLYMPNPPEEIKSGLLPQDMLVPQGLTIPENLKAITGNLEMNGISDIRTGGIKTSATKTTQKQVVPQLQNKTFYVTTNFNRNIQVISSDNRMPDYALAQKYVPVNIKAYNDRFLLVTSYGRHSLDIISLYDDRVIKQIELKTQPDEIVIDNKNRLAYISTPADSSIYVVNLQTMTLLKQIKVSGMCEKIILSDDGTKLFYYDKKSRDIWAVELNNDYLLRDFGRFPNVSKIAYANNKVYVTSRTKNRLAIIDYNTIGLIAELAVYEKPVDMEVYGSNLFILSAAQNTIQVLNTVTDAITDDIYLNTNGFSAGIFPVENTDAAIITDAKSTIYTVINLKTKQVLKTNLLIIPVSSIAIVKKGGK